MEIVDLTDNYKSLFFVCLEDWSEEMKDAGNHKKCWYHSMKDKGLRVKLALDEHGKVGGMIQYLPIEHSFVEGENLYFIYCIWVHGYKKGRGNFQKKGMGQALLQAAESDVKNLGSKGIVAWGLPLPFWMRASWFKKHGYFKTDKIGLFDPLLLWKPFSDDAKPPKWIRSQKKPELIKGKVTVTGFINGWCPAMNMDFERAKKAAFDLGDKVEFREINTVEKNTILEWGMSDAIFIDHKKLRFGPPVTYEKMRKLIAAKVKKLK